MSRCKRIAELLEDLFEYGYPHLPTMSQQDLEDLARILGYIPKSINKFKGD